MKISSNGRPLPKIAFGHHEPIFDRLPGSVIQNLRRARSENALLWNLIYPRAKPSLDLQSLLELRPLWGTPSLAVGPDRLRPYYWGYDRAGKRLRRLDQVLGQVDGRGQQTEVDLILLGRTNLIVVEAKATSGFGRCSRFQRGVCPEVHQGEQSAGCRYWREPAARFDRVLAIEGPPEEGDRPFCHHHYQLARTLLVGERLARSIHRRLHMWLITPRRNWRRLEPDWLSFAEQVRDPGLWRRMRVLAWEQVALL